MGKLVKVLGAINEARAAKAAAVGLGLLGGQEEAEAGVITKGGKKIIEAWHGSPHDFDKFDISKIGSGEGHQAYGHGLYFADEKETADMYRLSLAGEDQAHYVDGVRIGEDELRNMPYADKNAINFLGRPEVYDPDTILDRLREQGASDEKLRELSSALDKYRGRIEYKPELKGHTYKVHADVDPDTLLDWNVRLNKQPVSVQKSLQSIMGDAWDKVADKWDGRNFYKNWTGQPNDGEWMSERLRHSGVSGIRYQDQVSRGSPGGTYNYVMLDDAPISIVDKGNADPRLLAGIAGTGTAALAAPTVMDYLQHGSQPEAEAKAARFPALHKLANAIDGYQDPSGIAIDTSGLADYLRQFGERGSTLDKLIAAFGAQPI